jgi:hypothetical protein
VHLSTRVPRSGLPDLERGCSAPRRLAANPVLPSFCELERGKVTLFRRRSHWKILHRELEHPHSTREPFALSHLLSYRFFGVLACLLCGCPER